MHNIIHFISFDFGILIAQYDYKIFLTFSGFMLFLADHKNIWKC